MRAQSLSVPGSTIEHSSGCDCILVRSPVSGSILRVLNESEGAVASGTALAEIGNPRRIRSSPTCCPPTP
jgi:hypothetical protein